MHTYVQEVLLKVFKNKVSVYVLRSIHCSGEAMTSNQKASFYFDPDYEKGAKKDSQGYRRGFLMELVPKTILD